MSDHPDEAPVIDEVSEPLAEEPVVPAPDEVVEPASDEPVAEESVPAPDGPADEPAPEVPAPAAEPAPVVAPPAPAAPALRGVNQTPFLIYLALWVLFIVASAALLLEEARTTGALFSPRYEWMLYAGLALAALGPVYSLIVWLVTRARRQPDERRGLFAACMLSGAGVTFVGTALWVVLLFVLDLFHAGVLS